MEKERTEQNNTEILTTALNITSYRLETSTNSQYQNEKFAEFQDLEEYQQNTTYLYPIALTGVLSESLFYQAYSQIVGKDNIKPATGDEDLQGIDFYINGYPTDVTASNLSLTKKISTDRVPTIFLPKHTNQKNIFEHTSFNYNKNYIMQAIHKENIDNYQYIQDTYNINKNILQQIEQNPQITPKAGPNNLTNMKVILTILDQSLASFSKLNNKSASPSVANLGCKSDPIYVADNLDCNNLPS